MIEPKKYKVRIKLRQSQLGTVPRDKEVYKKHIIEKTKRDHPDVEIDEKEIESIEEVSEKGWTGFFKDDDGPFISNHMIKGFLKSAVENLITVGAIKKVVAHKKWIDNLVHIQPRYIHFSGKKQIDGSLERPLRAMTRLGERITVCRSDTIAPGTEIEFTILLFPNNKGLTENVIREALDWGRWVGLGQWRSAEYGSFDVIEWTPC